VTLEISLGDFVLSGGELPALALLDAVARLQPGVLTAASHEQDSFSDGLLDCPHYSRPERWPCRATMRCRRAAVRATTPTSPAGAANSAGLTQRRRPDLIAAARAAGRLLARRREAAFSLAASDLRYNRAFRSSAAALVAIPDPRRSKPETPVPEPFPQTTPARSQEKPWT
jgi:hypothetical protein